MSQTQHLFPAQASVTPITATGTTPAAATILTGIGNTLRVVNESLTDGAFLAVGIGTNTPLAIAALPTAGSKVSCWVGPGADFTISIPGATQHYASAITRGNTVQLQLYVGEGS